MTTILVIWTVVGFAGTNLSTYERRDWRPIGDFGSVAACVEAARQLGYPADSKSFRCLAKGYVNER